MENCERCGGWNENRKDRFCTKCKKALRDEMKEAGYLRESPRLGDVRGEAWRNAPGPRHCGANSGSWDNVVRAIEDG